MAVNEGMTSIFIPDTTFGFGSIKRVGDTIKLLGCSKPVIITDDGIVNAGLLKPIEQSLKHADIPYAVFSKCLPNAPLTAINECLKIVRNGKYDVVIAVGGGSVIDTAKVVSVGATETKPVTEYISSDTIKSSGIKKIYIPTTAGTASEWSTAAVVIDDLNKNTPVKKGFHSMHFRPDAVFIDPQMTLNLPQKITIDTGIDALSHGIEAFTTVKANVISDMFSSTCIQLTANYLRTAYGQGSKNPEARYNMAIASAFGFAFSISDLGLIHGLANPISLITHISHGEALAVIMPSVMEFNLIANIPKYAQIARLMGENTENLTLREQAQLSVKAVRTLIADIGLPRRLSDIGIKKEDIPRLADYVFDRQQHLIDPNPRIVSKNEVTSIYESAL